MTSCPRQFVPAGSNCIPRCENYIYSDGQWDLIQDSIFGFSLASLLSSVYVFLHTWGTEKAKGAPQARLLHVCVCTFALAVGFLIPHLLGREDTFCNDDQSPRKSGPCVLSGWLILTFSLSFSFWWMFIALNGFTVMLGWPRARYWNSQERAIVLVSYGFPLFCTAILLAAGKIGFHTPGAIICSASTITKYDMPLYYAPLTSIMGTGVILLLFIIFKLGRDFLGFVAGGHSDFSTMQAYFFSIGRLVMFLILFLATLVSVLNFRFEIYIGKADTARNISDWVACIFEQFSSNKTQAEIDVACGSTPRGIAWSDQTLYSFVFFTACTGVFLFITYGIRKNSFAVVFNSTARAFRHCRQGFDSEASNLRSRGGVGSALSGSAYGVDKIIRTELKLLERDRLSQDGRSSSFSSWSELGDEAGDSKSNTI